MSALSQIGRELEQLAGDASLRDEGSFERRALAIDALEFRVLDALNALPEAAARDPRFGALQTTATDLLRILQQIDERLFARLREEIRGGRARGAELLRTMYRLVPSVMEAPAARNYDVLDQLMTGVLVASPLPEPRVPLEPEMVFYQRTPSRAVLEMARRTRSAPDEVFYDLGSGLGDVAITLHLLTGVRATGIEIDPSYCGYARAAAHDLRLPGVRFIHDDARRAGFSDGTAFYLYTPFRGRLLAEVLERLRIVARMRTLHVFTYGPCTADVAREPWLRQTEAVPIGDELLACFVSVQ